MKDGLSADGPVPACLWLPYHRWYGVVLGAAAAFLLTEWLVATLLFETSPHDPVTLAAVAVVLTMVSLAAAYVPARRATRVDPIVALRAE